MTSWIAWVGNTRGPRVTRSLSGMGVSLLGAPRGRRVGSTHSGGWGTGKPRAWRVILLPDDQKHEFGHV